MFDLATIEIGSLESVPNGNQELDATRTYQWTEYFENGIQRTLFIGCPEGKAIRNEIMDVTDLFADGEDFDYEDFGDYVDENENLDADGDFSVFEQIREHELASGMDD
jgi:hypothetical protein